jgi:hypothetical protein
MRHTRAEVIKRATREFQLLDRAVARLKDEQWKIRVPRSETKEPWTVKDALAHITHWKADVIRSIQRQRRSPEAALNITQGNHKVYVRWHKVPPREVLAWHRQVQRELMAALKAAPDKWFSGREHAAEWPFDLDGHSAVHRVKDIEHALAKRGGK